MFNSTSAFNEGFFNQFRQLQTELENAFGRLPDISDIRQSARQGYPPTVVNSDENAIVVKLFAAGYEASDFAITVEKNLLKIDASKQDDAAAQENSRYHLRERMSPRINRVVTLPEDANVDEISAEYKHGVLTLTIARVEKASPRVVQVQ